jgi:putative SOS response-associated peptidase YedK
MRNLYNITTTHEAIIQWSRAMYDRAGNLEPSLDVYPNYKAPVVRASADGEREVVRLNWGMPSPPDRVKGKADYGTTNVRRPSFWHWRQWLGVEHRCIVPATSFAEPSPTPGDKDPATGIQRNFWFAIDEAKPLFFFAGIWTRWHGIRRVKDGPQDHELFGFFTTEPNGVVKPIHDKAMPVILTTRDQIETWLSAPWPDAMALQRPLPDDLLRLVEAPPAIAA